MDIPIPTAENDNYIHDFCKALSNKYSEIAPYGKQISPDNSKLIFQLYNFANTAHRPKYISESDWNYLKTNIYLFLSTLDPNEDQIPEMSLQIDDGILFSSIIIQYCIRANNRIFADVLVQAFDFILDTIINRDQPISIYTYSPSFYAKNLPKLVSNSLPDSVFQQRFVNSLQRFIHKKNTYLTDSDLAFYSEIVRIFIEREFCPAELFAFFSHLFDNYQHIPIQIINHFLNYWRMALSSNKNQLYIEDDKSEQASDILLQIAKMKVHDLPRSFPWHICFQFYESLLPSPKNQFKVFISINNIIRTIKRIDITNRIDSLAQLFFKVMKAQYKKGGGEKDGNLLLYYFLTNVVSTISSATARLNLLKGIQMKHSGSTIVSFAKQPQDGENVVDLDKELFTKFQVIECNTPEEEIRQFEHLKRTIDTTLKQLQFAVKFNIIEPFKIFDLMDLPLSNDRKLNEPTISLIYYFKHVFRSWLNFIISFSFRVTMMNHYLFQGDGLLKFNGQGPTIRRQMDYTMFHREVIDCILTVPKELIEFIIDEIIKVLISSLKNEILTHHFVISFVISLCTRKPSLKKIILSKMINHAVSNMQKLTSNSNKESHFLNQWILLFFRIGIKPNNGSDPVFFYILQNNQKLVVSNVINYMRQVTNPSETMRTFDWYRRMLYQSSGSKTPEVSDQEMLKIRRHLLDELPASSHTNALRIIFDPIMTSSKQTLTISLISSLLTEALNSKDQSIISIALKLFYPLLKKESIQKFCDFDFDKYQGLFASLFNSTIYASEEDANTIFHIIPSMVPFFIKRQISSKMCPSFVLLDNYGISIDEVIQSVNKNINDDDSEAAHLFILYTLCFEKAKQSFFSNPIVSSDTLTVSLCSLVGLYKYEQIRTQVFDFLLKQNSDFAKHMIQTHINTYFLIIFSVIGFSRSYLPKYTIDLMHNFLAELKKINVDESLISDTMNDILSSSNISISHFNIFVGIGTIFHHFPNAMTISHVGRLFSTTSENIQHDMKNLPLLNRFLKIFLNNSNEETKLQFAEVIYNRFHMIWYGYRFMITNRLSKCGVKLPLKSYNELISIENPNLFILKVSVAFACGISGSESYYISDELKTQIKKIIEGLDTSQAQHGFESKVVILIVYYSIVSNETARTEFLSETGFIETMFTFLKKMIYRKYPILFRASKKLFKKVFTTCFQYDSIKQVIEKFYANDPSTFLGSNILSSFVLHLTRIVPEHCPSNFAQVIIASIFEYSKKSIEEQMTYLSSFVYLLKLLVIPQIIQQKEIINIYEMPKDDHNYYYCFVDTLIRLCMNQEILIRPLIKQQMMKLFLNFPDQTMRMIIFEFSDIQEAALSVLEDIILIDTSNKLILSFIDTIVDHFNKINQISPCVYEMFRRLVKNDNIIKIEKVKSFGKNLFEAFSSEYNDQLSFGLHGFMSMMNISKIYLKIINQDLTYDNIYSFSKLFIHPSFRSSNMYKKFISTIFTGKDNTFFIGLLKYILEILYDEDYEDAYFIEIIISHSIKYISPLNEELQTFLWNEIDKMASNPKFNTIRLIILSRILEMKEIHDFKRISKIVFCLPQIFTESNPQHIFLAYKITQSLQKHELLPDSLFLHLISMFIRYGKYLDTPYAYCTMQLMKSRPDLLMKFNKDIIKSFIFFTLEKLPFLKDLQKIVFAVQAGPKFLDYLPFPVVTVITNAVSKKLSALVPNVKMNSSIENYLTCAIKICIYSQPPTEELQNLYKICFEYMKVVVKREMRVKDFPDILCSIILKYGIESFDIEFLQLLIMSETKEKYYFYFIACASKFLTNEQILSFSQTYTDAIRSISEEYFKINYVSTLFQGLTRNAELYKYFAETIDDLIKSLQFNVNENNIEVMVIIVQILFRSNLEIDKIRYINILWNFADELTEIPHLKQFYKFTMMLLDEIPIELQDYYYNLIKEHSHKSDKHSETFVSTAQILMKCSNVQNSIKINFVQHLNEFLKDYSIETLERLLETYDEYYEMTKIDLFKYKLPVYFHLMLHSTHNKSVIFAETIISSLGSSTKERFKNAYELLPLYVWFDDLIAAISILILGKIEGWQPMIVFASCFKDVGNKIFKKMLETIEGNEDSLIIMKNLLIKLNSLQNTKSAIEALCSILNNQNVNMALIVSGSLKYNKSFILNDFTTIDLIPDIFLLPHDLNDSIYSKFMSNNIFSAAAEAHFFLGNYDEALKIFECEDCSLETDFDSRIYELTKKLTSNDEFEFFDRFYCTTETSKTLISKLYESFVYIRNNVLETARPCLKETSTIFYHVNKEKEEKTVYERDFVDSIRYIIYHLERFSQEANDKEVELSHYPVYLSNISFNSLYQSVFKHMNKDLHFQLDFDDLIPQIMTIDDENYHKEYIMVTPGVEKMFNFINGYDKHGFAAVNIDTIIEHSKKSLNAKVTASMFAENNGDNNSNFKSYVNEHRWACLCFSLYTNIPSPTMLSSAFNSYIDLLNLSDFLPNFVKLETSARIITLLRLGLSDSTNDENIKICEKVSKLLVSPEYESKREIIQFWTRQIIELKNFEPFAPILTNKMLEYIGLSTAYSMKTKSFEEIIQGPVKDETVRSQLRTLHLFEDVIDFVFSIKFEEFQVQICLESILYELRNDSIDYKSINLVELRQKQPETAFSSNLCQLPLSLVEKLNDDEGLIERVKNCTAEEINEIIELFIPSSSNTFDMNKRELYHRIDLLNNNMPLPLPARITSTISAYLIFLQYKIRKINDSQFIFTFKTSVMKNHSFIIQRNENIVDQQKCTTFSSFLLLLKQINRYSHSNRIRSIRYSTYLGSDVGHQYIIYAVANVPITLEELFVSWSGSKSSEFLEISNNETSEIPDDVLIKNLACCYSKEQFLKNQELLLRSASATFFIDHLFLQNYPSMDSSIICPQLCEIPIMFHDISINYKDKPFSTFRLSPNVKRALGPLFKGKMIVSMASAAQNIVKFFESACSFIELIVCEELKDELTLASMIEMRDRINNEILNFSPPASDGSTPGDSVDWFSFLDSIIEKAADVSIQPIEQFPWF